MKKLSIEINLLNSDWEVSNDESFADEAEDEHEKSFNDLPLSDVCDFSVGTH